MFALEQRSKDQRMVVNNSDFFKGIDEDEILYLTYQGDLEEHFGKEGTTYKYEDCPWESRSIKGTTAPRYILQDEKKNWVRDPKVKLDKDNYHGIFSLNKGKFPFMLRPYKYICLRNGRNAKSDIILLELFDQSKWVVEPIRNIDEDRNLIDRDTGDFLIPTKDVIIDENLKRTEVLDETIVQWQIDYPIERVVKLKKVGIDWDDVLDEDV